MKNRCYDKRTNGFPNYGSRGITICNEWLNDFQAFHDWAMENGYSDELTIDRIDHDGNYEPSNCRWAKRTVQARNTRANTLLDYDGKRKTIAEWAEITGIKPATICNRLYKARWSIDDTLTLPVQPRLNDKPWENMGISRTTYYRRKKEGFYK